MSTKAAKLTVAAASTGSAVAAGGVGYHFLSSSSSSAELDDIFEENTTSETVYDLRTHSTFKKGQSIYWTNKRHFGFLLLNTNNRQPLWTQKFEKLTKDKANSSINGKIDTLFKNVNEDYSDSSQTSLNKVCSSIYEKTFHNTFYVKKTVSTGSNDEWEYKWDFFENFWNYCSQLSSPITLTPERSDKRTDSDPYIDYIYELYLPDASKGKNNDFWDIKQKWYEQLTDQTKPQKENFESYLNSHTNLKTEPFSIRKFCASAMLEKADETSIRVITVLKYCSYWDNAFDDWFKSNTYAYRWNETTAPKKAS